MSALLLCPSRPPPRQLKVRVEALLESSLQSTRPAQVCSGLLAKGTKPGQIRSLVVRARERVGTLTPGHSREGWGPASLLLALTWEPVAQGKKSKHTITVTPQEWLSLSTLKGQVLTLWAPTPLLPPRLAAGPSLLPAPVLAATFPLITVRPVILNALFSLYTK